jgi:hypothetical protein
MRRKSLSLAVSVLFLVACVAPLHAGPTTQKDKPDWQTDWKLYVAELGKDLQKGIDPGEDKNIKGRVVEFEGTLRKAFDPAKPDDTRDIEMEPQQVTVMLKLFPLVDAAKAVDKTGTVTVRKILVKSAEANRDAWKAVENGSKVRFRGTVGNDAAVLVTTSGPGEEPAGLVFLFLTSGEVIPPK